VIWLGWFSIQVEDVVAEAVDVLCKVRADRGDGVLRDGFPACRLRFPLNSRLRTCRALELPSGNARVVGSQRSQYGPVGRDGESALSAGGGDLAMECRQGWILARPGNLLNLEADQV
jgi:hypothetical protein